MKKIINLNSAKHIIAGAIMAGALLVAAATSQAGQETTNVCNFASLGTWWLNSWGGQSANTAFDPAVDHTGDGSGSLHLVDDYSGGDQWVNIGWLGGQQWGGNAYDLTGWTNISFYVKWDAAGSTMEMTTFNGSPGETPQFWGATANNGGWFTIGTFTIPNAASNGWVKVNVPVNPAVPGIEGSYCMGFKKWTGGGNTGKASFWVDDITLEGNPAAATPPPTVYNLTKPTSGLNLIALTGPYNRENVQSVKDQSWIGQSGTVSYAFTIAQAANGAGGAAYQNHIFLCPSPGTESGPDWTEPNIIFMDLESQADGGTLWTFRYKTNCANANNMCYNAGSITVTLTNGGSGYTSAPDVSFSGGSGIVNGSGIVTGASAQIDGNGVVTGIVVSNSWGYTTAPTISITGGGGSGAGATVTVSSAGIGALGVLRTTNLTTGTWTLSVSGGNSFTMTSPIGQSTNFTIPADAAALFAAPVKAYFGCQAGNAAGIGQGSVLSSIQITGTPNPVHSVFTGGTAINTNDWTINANDSGSVFVTPSDAAYWLKWSIPDANFSPIAAATLTSGNWTDVAGTRLQVNGQRWTLLAKNQLPSTDGGFFKLIKRSYSKLQVLLPGQTNAPGTVLGYVGTPTPISLAGQDLANPAPITVNACDDTWHLVGGVTHSISLTTSDTSAYLPTAISMVNGVATFSGANGLVFQTQGPQTVTATDSSDAAILPATSAPVTINP